MRQLMSGDADSADNFNLLFGQLMNNNYHLQNRINNSYLSVPILDHTFILDLNQNANFSITTMDTNTETIIFSNIPAINTNIISVIVVVDYTVATNFIYPLGTVWQNAEPVFVVGNKYVLMFESFLNDSITWTASYSLAWW